MAENRIYTKIALKYNDYAYWTTSDVTTQENKTHADYVPLKGEVCFCEIPKNNSAATTAPTVLFKVGDGKTPFKTLKWASALAADVYDWAKVDADTFLAWLDEQRPVVVDTDLDTRYSFEIESTDGAEKLHITKQLYTKGVAGKVEEVASLDFVTPTELEKELEDVLKNYYTKKEADERFAPIGDYKVVQTPYTDPNAANGKYVSKVTQNENGEITVEHATLPEIPEIPEETELTIDNKTQTDDQDTVYAVADLVEGGSYGHKITPTYKAVATKAYVDKVAAGAVDYLGTITAVDQLSTEAGKGDFYRVAAEIKEGKIILAFVGDLIVAEKDNPERKIDGVNWTAIHCGDGDISAVNAGEGLEGGGATGAVTISHAIPETGSAHATTAGSGRTYVTEVQTDKFGHITGIKVATEVDQEIPGASGSATIASVDAANVVTLKSAATLDEDEDGNHVLTNTGTDIKLAPVAKTGSAYDLNEANEGTDKDGNPIKYFVFDCNW